MSDFGRTFRLLPYFMCANSKGSGETARMHRGEAEVENHFEGWTFLLLPSQECTIHFIISKLLSGKKRYVLKFGFKMCGSI